MPHRIACVAEMQQNIKVSFSGITNTIEVINELAGSTDFVFPIPAMNDLYSVPFRFFIWMQA